MSNGNGDPIAEAFRKRREKELASDPIAQTFEKYRAPAKDMSMLAFLDRSYEAVKTGQPVGPLIEEQQRANQAGNSLSQFIETLGAVSPITSLINFERGLAGNWEPLRKQSGQLTAIGAGAAGQGALQPLEAVLQIPTMLVGHPTNRASDFVHRTMQGMYTEVERQALDLGLTHEQVQAAYNVGGFIGMTLPIIASVKAAGWAIGTLESKETFKQLAAKVPQLSELGMAKWALRGPIMTDWIAGAVYGGVFRPGDAEQRLKHMGMESALWGAGRIVLNTVTQPYVGWRMRRAYELDASGELKQALDDMMNGVPRVHSRETSQQLMTLLSDENFIAMSPAAQEIFARNEGDMAFIQAVKDLSNGRGTGTVFRNIGHTAEEADARIARMQQRYPHLKFSFKVKRVQKYRTTIETITDAAVKLPDGSYAYGKTHGQILDKVGAYSRPRELRGDVAPPKGYDIDLFRTSTGRVVGRDEAMTIAKNAKQMAESKGYIAAEGLKKVGTVSAEATRDVYDVYFGTIGITPKKLAQLKREGRFEGQIVQYYSHDMEYIGEQIIKKNGKPSKKVPGKVWVRAHAGAEPRFVKVDKLTDTPFARENWSEAIGPQWDALYQDLLTFSQERTRQVAAQRGAISEADLIRAVGKGQVDLGQDPRRLMNVNGAIVYPEEAGILGEESVLQVVGTPFWVEPSSGFAFPPGTVERMSPRQIADEGLEQRFSMIVRHTRERHATDVSSITSRNMMGDVVQAPKWKLTHFNPQTMEPTGHASFATLDEALKAMENVAPVLKVVKKYPTGQDLVSTIEQTATQVPGGLARTNLLHPPPVYTFEDMVEFWAKERGLPTDAQDYGAMVDHFRSRMRRWAWEQVPEKERALWKKALAEQAELLDGQELPLSVLAHEKGFYVQRLTTGQIWARQIDTGLPLLWGGERAAREALIKIVTPEASLPSILPMGADGLMALTGGFPTQNLFTIPGNIRALDFVKDLPRARMRNLWDTLKKIQNMTGWPIATEGFEPLIRAREIFMGVLDPEAKMVKEIWDAVPSRTRRYELTQAWVEAETAQLSLADAIKSMRDQGFTNKEVSAFTRARALWDRWKDLYTDIAPERYRQLYYGKIRPYLESNPGASIKSILELDPTITPREAKFWAELESHGLLDTYEMDPVIVMHKYIREALWKRHMKEPWDKMAILTGTTRKPGLKVKDLPPDMAADIIRQGAALGTTPESFVLPKPLRDLLKEFLVSIRGSPTTAEQTTRDFFSNIFHRLGIVANPRIVEELIGMHMSTMYGAAMGLRPGMVARNVMGQHLWNVYTRVGPKWVGPGIEASMTREGFDEALAEGVFHWQEAGVPFGDALSKELVDAGVYAEGGIGSKALAGAVQVGLRTGTISRKVAREFLVPYASGEQQVRAASYFTNKFHTGEWLTKWEEGKISYESFVENGLPFYDKTTIERFHQVYNQQGREASLRYIGRVGADEANFLYITGVQPTWMQKPLLRPFGMFGTFSMWQAELYFNRMRNGTLRQQAQFIARNMLLIAGFANMSAQLGINMWNWIAPTSMGWFGGPDLTTAFNLQQAMSAPYDRKAAAFKRLADSGMRLAYPGQAFMRDVEVMGEQPTAMKGVLSMFMGRPFDDESWAFENLYDPGIDRDNLPDIDPTQLPDLVIPEYMKFPHSEQLIQMGEPDTSRVRTRERVRGTVHAPLVPAEGNF